MSTLADLILALKVNGPTRPGELMEKLGVSQPTLFRWVKGAPRELIAVGGPRNRTVAALRPVRNLGTHFPVFEITSTGEAEVLGELTSLAPASFLFFPKKNGSAWEIFPGLPFYLEDVRPQGFLGRSFAQQNPDLKLRPRITDWSTDDVLETLVRRGEDLPGNLLVGAESFERYQLRKDATDSEIPDFSNPEKKYLQFADAAIDGHPPGSSAGGEHPKFTAKLRNRSGKITHVLVKFSPSGDSFSAERWRDLLVCEFLALEILRQFKVSAVEARIFHGSERTFLETTRFDRVGGQGRVGAISLSALENEWVGRGEGWNASATVLASQNRLSLEDLERVRLLECFGRLIANSDRHAGNLSFFWEMSRPQLELAPIYDMLPMLYAPINGEDSKKTFRLPIYDHTLADAWKIALPMAVQYWEQVSHDPRITKKFRKIAETNLKLFRS